MLAAMMHLPTDSLPKQTSAWSSRSDGASQLPHRLSVAVRVILPC